MKDNPIFLPIPGDVKGHNLESVYGKAVDLKKILSDDYKEELGDIDVLYDHVSNPNIHIKDKINALLRIHMFFSKEMLTNETFTPEDTAVYGIRKRVLDDLQGMIETLNEYTAVDNFDVEHPLYNKSLSFIIEAILHTVKKHASGDLFDLIVRDIATALPSIELRVKHMIDDSTTEDILALRENPLMNIFNEERELFEDYIRNRAVFKEWMNSGSN